LNIACSNLISFGLGKQYEGKNKYADGNNDDYVDYDDDDDDDDAIFISILLSSFVSQKFLEMFYYI